eukprot:1084688-Alexandrium_andersonii.AAC.1
MARPRRAGANASEELAVGEVVQRAVELLVGVHGQAAVAGEGEDILVRLAVGLGCLGPHRAAPQEALGQVKRLLALPLALCDERHGCRPASRGGWPAPPR